MRELLELITQYGGDVQITRDPLQYNITIRCCGMYQHVEGKTVDELILSTIKS